jgi:hypothetical protein
MKSEAVVEQQIKLEAMRRGCILWRNNVGACTDNTGRLIRYGLANDSAQMNKEVKSGDLIGIKFTTVTLDMVGQTIGQFVSVEVKKEGWKYTGRGREVAQQKWVDIVRWYGGLSQFAAGVDDLQF